MPIIYIIFFISLAGIIVMIGRKLVMLRNGQIKVDEDIEISIPDLDELKDVSMKSAKKYGYLFIFEIIKFYVKSSNLLKNVYKEVKVKVKNVHDKYFPKEEKENNKNSKFIKMISDYKHKIRKIKHEIIEEEKKL